MNWTPAKEGLEQLVALLGQSSSSDNAVQRHVQQQLEAFNKISDYNNYLAFIFCSPELDSSLRAIAGLTLKNNVRRYYEQIQPTVIDYIKQTVLKSITDHTDIIRITGGNVITTLVQKDILRFSDVLQTLFELLDNQDHKVVRGSISALQKTCEDSCRKLSESAPTFLNALIPKLIGFFQHPDSKIRVGALHCINQFVLIQSQALMVIIEHFVAGLYQLTNDANDEVRKAVCQSFVMILEVRPDTILPQISNVVDFMLFCTQSEDEAVSLEACEFWLTFADQDELKDCFYPYLQKVLPVLLKKMVYSEEDIMLMDADEEASYQPDKAEDIKPRHYKAKTHDVEHEPSVKTNTAVNKSGALGEEDEDEDDYEDDDEDDDDIYSEWNIRKCSASALDRISTVYGNHILSVVLPHIKQELFHASWEHRECGILVLGAIAEGCMDGMIPHLPTIIPMLLNCLADPKALVRSISCWTIGRYVDWIVFSPPDCDPKQHITVYMHPLIEHLLKLVLDNHKKVQEAACSTLSIVEENARLELLPFLPHILTTLIAAFSKYQAKNILVLYDTIATLAESVGPALNKKQFIDILMPPLTLKWSSLTDDDRDLFPLFECLSSVSAALGSGFQPYAQPVWERCLRLIHMTLQHVQYHEHYPDTEEADKDFLIVALDLISGIVQGLGKDCEPLVMVGSPNLLQVLEICSRDPLHEVQQSVFALYGDMAIHVYSAIKPYVNAIYPALITHIDPDCPSHAVSACNNAVWAAGEIALQDADMTQFIGPAFERAVRILQKDVSRTLKENAAITLGRFGVYYAQLVSPFMDMFLQQWSTTLAGIRDNGEKESAFLGVCKMIELHPQGVVKHLVYFCHVIVSWNRISPELNGYIGKLLAGIKQMMGDEQWQTSLGMFPAEIRDKLSSRYTI